MEITEKSVMARNEVSKHMGNIEFDYAVLLTYNSSIGMGHNFHTFIGHPEAYGKKELQELAIKVVQENLKAMHIENPETRTGGALLPRPKISVCSTAKESKRATLLGAVGIDIQKRRLWISLIFRFAPMGIFIDFYEGLNPLTNIEYWSLEFLFGCISLRLSRDK